MIWKSRRVKIWLIALAVVVAIFALYLRFFRTPPIDLEEVQSEGQDIRIPDFDKQAASVGEIKVGETQRSRFTRVDPVTKELEQVFEFDKLVNPEADSKRWTVIRPQVDLYRGDFRYRITAQNGTALMETVAGSLSPVNADFQEDVEIQVRSEAENRLVTTIYLDDLEYDSERSQFSTDGPVRLVAEDADMEGKGLLVIYNEALNRLELLKIYEVDFIHMRNVGSEEEERSPESASDPQETSSNTEPATVANANEGTEPSDPPLQESELQEESPDMQADSSYYYTCEITDNVRIEYGPDIIINADRKVQINNILWGQGDDSLQTEPSEPASAAPQQGQTVARATVEQQGTSQARQSSPEIETNTTQTGRDVRITCDGPLTVQPIDRTPVEEGISRVVEFFGCPVQINQIQSEQSDTLAQCARLHYNVDEDILSMFTDPQEQYISLSMTDSQSKLLTRGSVQYRRKDQRAKIHGPGVLYSMPDSDQKGSRTSELNFEGTMELFFADVASTGAGGSELVLRAADLDGPMQARIHDDQKSHVSANRAHFVFENSNVSRADLEGEVHFAADSQGQGPSHVLSDMARLTFDTHNRIQQADMAGNVSFQSKDGTLTSQRAKVIFASIGAENKIEPVMLQSSSEATLETKAGNYEAREPTRFRARRIDYDMRTGAAYAHGPVEFTFFPEPEPGQEESLPIVITATESAEYTPDLAEVVFVGDVVAQRTMQTPQYRQESYIYGDRLIANLDSETREILHARVIEGQVRFEAKRFLDADLISHVVLRCVQMDYDAVDELITAVGPGDIKLNNANVPPPAVEPTEKFSLERPCYALIEGFDQLMWYTQSRQIVANGGEKSLFMSYMPIVKGIQGNVIRVATTRLNATYIETQQGRNELTGLTLADGVTYEEVNEVEFLGGHLLYEPTEALVTVTPSPGYPCMIQRKTDDSFMPVDRIIYYTDSGDVRFTLPGSPNVISSRRK